MIPIGMMWGFLKTNKVAQYALAVVLAVAVYTGWTIHQRNIGRAQGEEKQKSVETQSIGKEVLADTKTHEAEISESRRREDAANLLAKNAQTQASDALKLAAQLQRDSQALRDKVAGISDANLHQFNIGELKLRDQGDSTACYTPREERAIAGFITQGPACTAIKEQDEKALSKRDEQISGLTSRIEILLDRDAKRERYAGRMRAAIETLYNNHPPAVKSWKCVKLWKCGKGKLDIPDPRTLEESGPGK